jgi:regulatory protein
VKTLTPAQAKLKIQQYCAYQERNHYEVRSKLLTLGLRGDDVEELIASLITDGFLNEERYAKAFAGGKFRMKKWGRLKIVNHLESKGLSSYCIRSGLKEIPEEDYIHTLKKLIASRSDDLVEANIFAKRDKLSKFAIGKGYEPELVWTIVKELLPD